MDRKWNNKAFYYEDAAYQLEMDLQDTRRALIYLLDEPDDEECFICNRLRCRCAEYTLTSYRTTPSDIPMDFPANQSNDTNSELDYSCLSYHETSSEISEFDYVDFAPPPHASSSFEESDIENEEYDVVENSPGFPTPPPANALPTPPWECKTPEEDEEVRAYYDDLLKWVQASHPEITEGGPNMPFPIDESINNEINLSWPPHPKSIWRYPQPEYSRSATLFAYYRNYTMRFYDMYQRQTRERQLYHQFFS